MHFTKMEGLGNDYIYLNCLLDAPRDLPALAVRLSQRHFGVGADGLICVFPGGRGDFRMEMYNADGSVGEMCGNGIRCLGKYLYDKGLTRKMELTIETAAGPRQLYLHIGADTAVDTVTVDMGAPGVFPRRRLTVDGEEYTGIPVSMGNPHLVLFCDDPDRAPVGRVGPLLERHPAFPDRTNVEFLSVPRPEDLRLRVWERGSGETLACGTGACACFAAALKEGRCGEAVTARLPGGALTLRWTMEGHILMAGPAHTVYEGEVQG